MESTPHRLQILVSPWSVGHAKRIVSHVGGKRKVLVVGLHAFFICNLRFPDDRPSVFERDWFVCVGLYATVHVITVGRSPSFVSHSAWKAVQSWHALTAPWIPHRIGLASVGIDIAIVK